jgi:hypothetical protein
MFGGATDGKPISARIFIPFCPGAPHTIFFFNFLLYMDTGMGAQSGAPGMYRPKLCSVSYAHVVFEITLSVLLPDDRCL